MMAEADEELELELGLDGVDVHIQANLEDALVQEALKTGVDLRQYSAQVEAELQEVERASIRDCILLPPRRGGCGVVALCRCGVGGSC